MLDPGASAGPSAGASEGHGSQPQILSPLGEWSEESEETYHPPMAPGDQVQHSQVGSMTPASPRGVVVCRAMGDADIAPEVTDSQV